MVLRKVDTQADPFHCHPLSPEGVEGSKLRTYVTFVYGLLRCKLVLAFISFKLIIFSVFLILGVGVVKVKNDSPILFEKILCT